MTRYIGLLRGINVGGRRSLKMTDLRDLVVEVGGTDVLTYIQSGNVVFSHPARSAPKLEAELARSIEAFSGMAVPVVLRTADEWDAIVEANPYPDAGDKQLHVLFFKEDLPADAFAALDLVAFAPEALVARNRELYLHLPNGMGRAKLPVEVERRGPKAAIGTARNWATVLKLQEMARAS
ncbi:MAG: DUF1697 domain-containing protein [Dehalococcoidia bacterium]|nr:DUF1697 domain-containing protein [Dehalococcoidia bacterium]